MAPTRVPRWAVWLVAALALSAFGARATFDPGGNEGDLRVYYDQVQRIAAGRDLYHHREDPADPDRPTGYIYPPPFAVAFLPLTALPFPWVRLLWFVGSGLVALRGYECALRLVARERGPPARPWAALALGVTLSIRFVWSDLGHGQVNLLVAWLTLEGVLRLEDGRERSGAALLAGAVLVKLTPAIVVLGYLLAGRRRAFAWTVGAGLALALLPGLVLGPLRNLEYLLRFAVEVNAQNYAGHALRPDNAALTGAVHHLLAGVAPGGRGPPEPLLLDLPVAAARAASLALSGAALGAAALWAARAPAARRSPVRRTAVLLAAIPLVSPVAWKPHLVCLILPGVLAGRDLLRPGRARGLVAAGGLLLAGSSRGLCGRFLSDLLLRWGGVTAGAALLAVGLATAPPEADAGPEEPAGPSEGAA